MVLFHLSPEVAGVATQITYLGGVFRSDDETELVVVLPAPRQEGATLLAFACHPVPFDMAQMSIARLAPHAPHLWVALDLPRGVPLPSGGVLGEGCRQLGAPAAGVEPAASLSGRTA